MLTIDQDKKQTNKKTNRLRYLCKLMDQRKNYQ